MDFAAKKIAVFACLRNKVWWRSSSNLTLNIHKYFILNDLVAPNPNNRAYKCRINTVAVDSRKEITFGARNSEEKHTKRFLQFVSQNGFLYKMIAYHGIRRGGFPTKIGLRCHDRQPAGLPCHRDSIRPQNLTQNPYIASPASLIGHRSAGYILPNLARPSLLRDRMYLA